MFSVSYPRGDIFRQVGSDDRVELYCHLNPAHSYFKKVRLVVQLFCNTTQRDCKLKSHKLLVLAKSPRGIFSVFLTTGGAWWVKFALYHAIQFK